MAGRYARFLRLPPALRKRLAGAGLKLGAVRCASQLAAAAAAIALLVRIDPPQQRANAGARSASCEARGYNRAFGHNSCLLGHGASMGLRAAAKW